MLQAPSVPLRRAGPKHFRFPGATMTEIPHTEKPMLSTSAFAETAALLGDLTRANMMAALMDGRALTATDLARVAGITPQTASGHLALLTAAGPLTMERKIGQDHAGTPVTNEHLV